MSYMGIDIGTSGCKAVVFDHAGNQLAVSHRSYSLNHLAPGYAELDSKEVINSCCIVIAETARKVPCDPVAAIGVSSQGEAFTPVGAGGTYLDNAMVSSDSRAFELIKPFVESFGLDRLYNITGHTPSPLFSLFKLLWIKRNKPELWKKRPRFLCFEDLLQERLGVKSPAMGWPLAGRTMLFDVKNHVWNKEILSAVDIDESQLARPLPSGSIAGIVSDRVAAELGLPRSVKVVTGGHDQTIGALGAGVIEPGSAMYAAGSVECLCPVIPQLTLSEELCCNNLCSYDYSIPDTYTSVAYSLTGSNLLQYFKDNYAVDVSYDELVDEVPESPSSLMVLPYFTPSGTPYFDQFTSGTVMGWRLSTSRGELLKALQEGIALEMKLNLSLLENSEIQLERLIATGGGSRFRKFLQLKANVLNKPIESIEISQAGCLGAARLAQSADLDVPVINLVQRERSQENIIMPDPAQAEFYQRRFEQYKTFYSEIKELTHKLGSLG